MKQVILISRVHPYKNQEEFSKYSTGENPIIKEEDDLRLLVIKGSSLYALDGNSEKVAAILEIVRNRDFDREADTVIAYHYRNDLDHLIQCEFKEDRWSNITVKQYGAGNDETINPLYQHILNPLGQAFQNNDEFGDLLKKLWHHFADDHLHEAKLNLLYACRTPSGIPPTLDPILDRYKSAFKTFSEKVEDIQSTKEANSNDPEYITALEALRKSLRV